MKVKLPLCCIVNPYFACSICGTKTCERCWVIRDAWRDLVDSPSSNSPCRGCGEVAYICWHSSIVEQIHGKD